MGERQGRDEPTETVAGGWQGGSAEPPPPAKSLPLAMAPPHLVLGGAGGEEDLAGVEELGVRVGQRDDAAVGELLLPALGWQRVWLRGQPPPQPPAAGGRCLDPHPIPASPDLIGVQRGEGVQGGVGGDGEGVEAAQGSLWRQRGLSQAPPPSLAPPAHMALTGRGGSPRRCPGTQHRAETLSTRCTHQHPLSNTRPGPSGTQSRGQPCPAAPRPPPPPSLTPALPALPGRGAERRRSSACRISSSRALSTISAATTLLSEPCTAGRRGSASGRARRPSTHPAAAGTPARLSPPPLHPTFLGQDPEAPLQLAVLGGEAEGQLTLGRLQVAGEVGDGAVQAAHLGGGDTGVSGTPRGSIPRQRAELGGTPSFPSPC